MNSCGSGRDSPEFGADWGGLQRIGTDTNGSERIGDFSRCGRAVSHWFFIPPCPPVLGIGFARDRYFVSAQTSYFCKQKLEILVPRTLGHAGAALIQGREGGPFSKDHRTLLFLRQRGDGWHQHRLRQGPLCIGSKSALCR